jgi:hypothetical protein
LSDDRINQSVYDEMDLAGSEETKDLKFDFRAEMKGASAEKLNTLKETLFHMLIVLASGQFDIDSTSDKLEEVKGYLDGGAGHHQYLNSLGDFIFRLKKENKELGESESESESEKISVDKGKSPEVPQAEHTATLNEPAPVKSSVPKDTLLFADIPALAELNLTLGEVQKIIASFIESLERKLATPELSETDKDQKNLVINS